MAVEVLLLLLQFVRMIVPTTQPGGQPGGQAAMLGHATDDCKTWAKVRRLMARGGNEGVLSFVSGGIQLHAGPNDDKES